MLRDELDRSIGCVKDFFDSLGHLGPDAIAWDQYDGVVRHFLLVLKGRANLNTRSQLNQRTSYRSQLRCSSPVSNLLERISSFRVLAPIPLPRSASRSQRRFAKRSHHATTALANRGRKMTECIRRH